MTPLWNNTTSRKRGIGGLRPAISELKRSLYVVNTNAPINEKEGNLKQAKFERSNAASYKAAIKVLEQV